MCWRKYFCFFPCCDGDGYVSDDPEVEMRFFVDLSPEAVVPDPFKFESILNYENIILNAIRTGLESASLDLDVESQSVDEVAREDNNVFFTEELMVLNHILQSLAGLERINGITNWYSFRYQEAISPKLLQANCYSKIYLRFIVKEIEKMSFIRNGASDGGGAGSYRKDEDYIEIIKWTILKRIRNRFGMNDFMFRRHSLIKKTVQELM